MYFKFRVSRKHQGNFIYLIKQSNVIKKILLLEPATKTGQENRGQEFFSLIRECELIRILIKRHRKRLLIIVWLVFLRETFNATQVILYKHWTQGVYYILGLVKEAGPKGYITYRYQLRDEEEFKKRERERER